VRVSPHSAGSVVVGRGTAVLAARVAVRGRGAGAGRDGGGTARLG